MFTVVFHSCYYNMLDNGCRIYGSSDPYLDEHANMFTILGQFDNIEDADLFITRQLCEGESFILIRKENDTLGYEIIMERCDNLNQTRYDFVAGPFNSWDELYNAYEEHNGYEPEPEKYLLDWE